jgi:hypothetical protein
LNDPEAPAGVDDVRLFTAVLGLAVPPDELAELTADFTRFSRAFAQLLPQFTSPDGPFVFPEGSHES